MPCLAVPKPILRRMPEYRIGNNMSEQDYRDLRREYDAEALRRTMLAASPMEQFGQWLAAAQEKHPDDATSMSLATVDSQGWPSARIVLLKHFDEQGLVWYTDTHSRKGQALAANPRAELLFYWKGLERQVRIQGRVEAVSAAEADQYFNSRPLGSRLSAAASQQSSVVQDRAVLEAAVAAMQERYPDGQVPRPARWGGYRLLPQRFEFWQGRTSRLHDRFEYVRQDDGWLIQRLAP